MITCLQLNCFANHHGQCVGDRELAIQLSNCDKWDKLPVVKNIKHINQNL